MKDKDLEKSEYEELYTLLSPKQRKFVEFLDEGNSGTQAALLAGYGGKNGNKESAAVAASRLLKNDNVKAFRRARTNLVFDALGISKETLTLKMHDIYEDAVKNSDGQVALKALSEIAKVLGLNDEHKTITVGGLEEYLKNKASEGGGVNY